MEEFLIQFTLKEHVLDLLLKLGPFSLKMLTSLLQTVSTPHSMFYFV